LDGQSDGVIHFLFNPPVLPWQPIVIVNFGTTVLSNAMTGVHGVTANIVDS